MSILTPQTYKVAAVTFANGGDNISIYIPLFAGNRAFLHPHKTRIFGGLQFLRGLNPQLIDSDS
ncbi:hypothetical protein GXM_08270 [Nostoc sphaeroides CCNUC1]|uniref:Uncharacterized protein n=1 Tax=Nostoc sphaeroides CCNUC1 TaxID=2653204 RepID=A0A5P8WF10_9NOSO|nr:hypothetical protein GXM_08270 [Nostoc sphaeroides CCNUC1]